METLKLKMKQVLTIALVCALLIATQSAGYEVKVKCVKNESCADSKTQFDFTVASMNATFS